MLVIIYVTLFLVSLEYFKSSNETGSVSLDPHELDFVARIFVGNVLCFFISHIGIFRFNNAGNIRIT
jgi:hypothetical protein